MLSHPPLSDHPCRLPPAKYLGSLLLLTPITRLIIGLLLHDVGAGGLANALESALDAASGGQQSLINEAEIALNAADAATSLLGTDVSIGEINASESMSIDAGVQIVASASGSLTTGTVTIGGSRDDDALTLEVLSLAVGDEVIDVLDP